MERLAVSTVPRHSAAVVCAELVDICADLCVRSGEVLSPISLCSAFAQAWWQEVVDCLMRLMR